MLAFFDKREPFFDCEDETKIPVAYGIENLKEYHKRYSDFESLLYGASSYYRDHVFHSIRTWMLGVFCLLKKMNGAPTLFIEQITIDGISDDEFNKEINFFEKISMWTLVALCHDLGYPLEKSQQILDKTQKMMKNFIPNPNIWNNFGFSGVQDSINEYIIKFMSTKMILKSDESEMADGDKVYLGRVQPKYYLKYTKSLEHFNHGIISSVIIYKMLLYFLESDFNLNDDYKYQYEDARQFYIRREILRAMASHTCSDIYNIYLTTFSSMLFLCDELQEWGRKSWNDLYSGLQPNAVKLEINQFTPVQISVQEEIDMEKLEGVEILLENIERVYERQYENYKVIFRDGQHTKYRNFNFEKKMEMKLVNKGAEKSKVIIKYGIKANGKNYFNVDIKECAHKEEIFVSRLQKLKENKMKNEEIEILE